MVVSAISADGVEEVPNGRSTEDPKSAEMVPLPAAGSPQYDERGYTAGRSAAERALGRVLAIAMPHTWLSVSGRPGVAA